MGWTISGRAFWQSWIVRGTESVGDAAPALSERADRQVHGRTPYARPGAGRGVQRPVDDYDTAAQDRFVSGDLVQRNFTADTPDTHWVADITYVPTWSGFVYVAFIMDLFSRMIAGRRVDTTLRTDLALDALEHALWERKRKNMNIDQLIHHSDKGSQYVSIAYTERLREAGIEASAGSTGDSYDNAAAEALNKLYKKEVVWREGPWTGRDAVEFATLEWVHWYNHTRPHSYCGDLGPAQFEEHYYTETSRPVVAGVPL